MLFVQLANKDFLFVQTERNNFCVLAYDTSSGLHLLPAACQ